MKLLQNWLQELIDDSFDRREVFLGRMQHFAQDLDPEKDTFHLECVEQAGEVMVNHTKLVYLGYALVAFYRLAPEGLSTVTVDTQGSGYVTLGEHNLEPPVAEKLSKMLLESFMATNLPEQKYTFLFQNNLWYVQQ